MQVVAASATVGRPLRRELFKILEGKEGSYGDMPVLRPLLASTDPLTASISTSSSSRDIRIDDPNSRFADEGMGQKGSTRQIGIPSTIRHIAILSESTGGYDRRSNSRSGLTTERSYEDYKIFLNSKVALAKVLLFNFPPINTCVNLIVYNLCEIFL